MGKKPTKGNEPRATEHQDIFSPEAARRMLGEMVLQQTQLAVLNEELQRAHAAVEASQARYFDFYDIAPVGYLTISAKGMIVEANLTIAKLLGVKREALLRQELSRFIVPEDQDGYYSHIWQLFTSGAAGACEFRLLRKEGEQKWIRMESVLTRSTEEGPFCQTVLIDITERKCAEAALLENETKYRQLFELESDALFLIDNQSGQILDANFSAVALYGYSRDELLAMRNFDLSAEQEATKKASANVGSNQKVAIPIRYHRKKDGTVFPVEITATSLVWKGRPVHIPAIRDIAERVRVEEKLRESEEQYRLLVDNSHDIIYTITPDGRLSFVSRACTSLLGYPVTEMTGKNFRQFVHSEDIPLYEAWLQNMLETGQQQDDLEYRIRHIDGTWRWYSSSGVPAKDETGAVISVYGIAKDITQRKMTENAMRRSVEIQAILREIAEAAVMAPTMNELYETVYRLVSRVLPSGLFHINLLDEVAGEIVVPFRVDDVTVIPARRPLDKGMTEYFLRLGHAAHITPAEMDKLTAAGEYTLGEVQKINIRHYLGAPLTDAHGKPFGVISFLSMKDEESFYPEDVEAISIIAAQVSMAIERKHLEEELQYKAITDGLTGLFNRRHFLMRAEEEVLRIQRYGGICAMLMMDIDHFKKVNDKFGHAVGDIVLQRAAVLCREAIRTTDLLGRVGGEEFAFLLLESGRTEAMQVAERLRLSMQNAQITVKKGIQIPIRVSIGVAEHHVSKETLSDLMNRADKALYRAKSEGRNRVAEME